jgi:hypothetical protein
MPTKITTKPPANDHLIHEELQAFARFLDRAESLRQLQERRRIDRTMRAPLLCRPRNQLADQYSQWPGWLDNRKGELQRMNLNVDRLAETLTGVRILISYAFSRNELPLTKGELDWAIRHVQDCLSGGFGSPHKGTISLDKEELEILALLARRPTKLHSYDNMAEAADRHTLASRVPELCRQGLISYPKTKNKGCQITEKGIHALSQAG